MGLKRQIQLQEVIKNEKKNAETTGASLGAWPTVQKTVEKSCFPWLKWQRNV